MFNVTLWPPEDEGTMSTRDVRQGLWAVWVSHLGVGEVVSGGEVECP